MKRRNFLALSAVAASAIFTGIYSSELCAKENLILNNDFDTKLLIPTLLEGKEMKGVYHYDLNIQEAQHPFFKNVLTRTYAVNDTYLAPTLRLINGQKVSINYTNNLSETTTMHGHGMHLPPEMDGSAHQPITPNKTWSAKYKVSQRACTNWYHPHALDKTAKHVYKGLAGLIIIEDDESQRLDLPKEYGVDDIPLVLQDRFFDRNGQIDYSPSMHQIMLGYKGDTFIANGVINPYVDIPAKEVRFRLLNGSNSTVYELSFSDNQAFKQIAGDNSFLEKPIEMKVLRLSPGERAEIVLDLSDKFNQSFYLVENRQKKAFVKINVNQNATSKTSLPEQLTSLDAYSLKDVTKHRSFVLSAMMGRVSINNKTMNMNRIDEVLKLNQVEIWEVTNQGMMMMRMEHNFHIHATHFRIIERNGSYNNVLENEKGYKDTVYLAPGDTVKLLVKMTDYSSKKTPYMYHCHFLEHEDAGMMGQFLVI